MQLSKKQKSFPQFSFSFSKVTFNFEHFQKKMILIADGILNVRTPKNVVG